MPDQLFTYYRENALVISINSGIWEFVMVIRLHIQIWVIGKGDTKKGGNKGGWEKRYGVFWVLWPLYMLRCISTVMVEGACERYCRGPVVCLVGIIG
jgi:hypothetical protein